MKIPIQLIFILCSTCSQAFEIGFYNPEGVDHRFKSTIDFVMMEVLSEDQVLNAMSDAQDMDLSLTLNLGPSLTRSVNVESLNSVYVDSTGHEQHKLFSPKYPHKIKKFVTDSEVHVVLDHLILALQKFPDVIDTIFLIDEPYLKGVSRAEVNRVASLVKGRLEDHGLTAIKVGAVFASLMYESDFARELDRQAVEYVRKADTKRAEIENLSWFSRFLRSVTSKDDWIDRFREHRLITYDQAGNIYTGGGIPENLDVIGFDFYVATLLFDDLYVNSLLWIEERYDLPACSPFKGRRMPAVRDHLSFIGTDEIIFNDIETDDELLDTIFDCRIGAVSKALQEHLTKSEFEVVMIGESSSNGFLNFNGDRTIRDKQDWELVELRVKKEVERHLDRGVVKEIPNLKRVAFFTFGNPTDHSIGQTIRGAQEMPHVFDAITSH